MFRRSRIKIVAIIMIVSFSLIAGMLCIIYAISHKDMYRSHQEMLRRYVDDYDIRPDGNMHDRPDMLFELSTFYSVKYDVYGSVTEYRRII